MRRQLGRKLLSPGAGEEKGLAQSKAGLDFVHKTSAILKVLQINAGTELGTGASPPVF